VSFSSQGPRPIELDPVFLFIGYEAARARLKAIAGVAIRLADRAQRRVVIIAVPDEQQLAKAMLRW